MKLAYQWLFIALLAFGLAACSSTGTRDGDGADAREGGAAGSQGAETSGISGSDGWSGSSLADKQLLEKKTLYFEFDSSDLSYENVQIIRAHAAKLLASPGVRLDIEGHCDERGTREYNMALGERRAEAVRRFMLAEGVASSQLGTISYGEERPADPNSGESAWAMNRRAELVYR